MKNKVLLVLFLSILTFYGMLIFAQKEGYYKSKNEKVKTLTTEQIKEFEQDIQNGKSIDVRKYVLYDNRNYSNNISSNIYNISLKLESILDTSIKFIFNSMAKDVNN